MASLNRFDTQGNIKMDLESSNINKRNGEKEESVEELIKKLNARGTKVKILTGDDA